MGVLRESEIATVVAFAEAMAPGLGGLPPADPAAARDAAERLVEVMPRRSRIAVRTGIRTFEWTTFPRRFSRLPVEERAEKARQLEASRVGLLQDLLLLLKILSGFGYGMRPEVMARIGYAYECRVLEGSSTAPAPPAALGDLEPRLPGEQCDVVVVGSGAGGAAAATRLAEAGLDVIVLEAGRHHDRRSYPDDPLTAIGMLYRDGGLTVAEGRPMIPVPLGRAVGGTTVINSGTCFRTPEPVLAEWYTNYAIEWAAELGGEFDEIERMLAVAPVDVERMGRNGQLLMEGAQRLGVSHHPLSRNAGSCHQCNTCPMGCRLDAKQAMHVSYLPRAVAAGARIRAGVEARRVIVENGRAVGVECVSADGASYEVRARAVVSSAGAIGTPELLLRSGLHDPGGQLGQNLRIHPAAWVGALFGEEVRGWEGIMQSYCVDEWKESRGVVLEATFTPLAFGAQWLPGVAAEHQERLLAYDRLASTGVHISDRSRGRVGVDRSGGARVSYWLSREDADRLVFGIARAAELMFAAGAREVYSQVRGRPVIARRRVKEFEFSRPSRASLRLEAFHPMGTARMSGNPALGAVATDGALRGVDGVYVADTSLFPTSLGVNPMLTAIAMSAIVGAKVAESLS